MLATAALLLALPAAPQDLVVLVDGGSVPCKIEQAGLEDVRCRIDGAERTFDARRVLRIEFGDRPAQFEQAERFLQELDFQNAVNLFAAAAELDSPEWIGVIARLRQAEALLAWAAVDPGRASEAADAFNAWLAANPDHYYATRAKTGRARATAVTGNVEEAARQLEELASFAFERNLGKHVEVAARLDRCEVYLLGGQHQIAESRLRDLVPEIQQAAASAETEPALRPVLRGLLSRGQIDLGEAMEGRGGPAATKPYWEGLLRDRTISTEVRASAYVGLAQAARAEGKLRDAQFLLARVVATLPVEGDVLAHALFHLGEVCEELRNVPTPATPYYRRVVTEFPHSPVAAEARAKLGG